MEVGNILERKPDILSTIREESILRYSIKNCPEEKLIAVLTTLIENGADVNDTRGENMSPLNTAALWLKHPKNAVKLLLSSGALVNHQDDQGDTAMHCLLHLASACVSPASSLRLFKNAGADFSLVNIKGLTVKQQASQRIETYSKDEQALILSICDEEVPKVALKPSGEKTNSNLSSKKAIVEKWLTQSVEEIEDSESSRESQTSIFDDLKTLRDENIKLRQKLVEKDSQIAELEKQLKKVNTRRSSIVSSPTVSVASSSSNLTQATNVPTNKLSSYISLNL